MDGIITTLSQKHEPGFPLIAVISQPSIYAACCLTSSTQYITLRAHIEPDWYQLVPAGILGVIQTMLRISKLADYAVIITNTMATKPERAVSAAEIAMRTRLATPTVRKVMKQLLHEGLLTSSRGASGGYQLTRQPAEITLADIVEAIDGPISLVDCANPAKCCPREHVCGVQDNWQIINTLIKNALSKVDLTQVTARTKLS